MLLRDFLRRRGVSLSLIRSVKTHGGYFANGAGIYTNAHVKAGQCIEFNLCEKHSENVVPQEMPLNAPFENEHAILLNKPPNVAVHPTYLHNENTLANGFCALMLKRETPKPFRPINRIDKNTSGLVLCAMNEYAAPLLANSAQKIYFAVAEGKTPESGEINLPIDLKEGSFITRCVAEGGKECITKYVTLAYENGHSLVAVRPVTGRTHQIRVHFAHIGHPLAGDDMYGGKRDKISRHALHCGLVQFCDVSKKYGAMCKESKAEQHAKQSGEVANKAYFNTSIKIGQTCKPLANIQHINETISVFLPLPHDMQSIVNTDIDRNFHYFSDFDAF